MKNNINNINRPITGNRSNTPDRIKSNIISKPISGISGVNNNNKVQIEKNKYMNVMNNNNHIHNNLNNNNKYPLNYGYNNNNNNVGRPVSGINKGGINRPITPDRIIGSINRPITPDRIIKRDPIIKPNNYQIGGGIGINKVNNPNNRPRTPDNINRIGGGLRPRTPDVPKNNNKIILNRKK